MRVLYSLLFLCLGTPAFAGGVSGGGGNTKPAHPVTAQEVRTSIANARRYVYGRLNQLEWYHSSEDGRWEGHEDLWSRLFGPSTNMIDTVLALKIRVEENGPCVDPAGNEMDGSAHMNPPEVCLSLPRLTEKLGKDGLRSQVVALAAHEYSHLLGSTEAEADFLQNMILDDLVNADFIGFDKKFDEAGDGFGGVYLLARFPNLEDKPPVTPADWLEGRETIKEVREAFEGKVVSSRLVEGFQLSGHKMQDYYRQSSVRMELMERAACLIGNAKDRETCRIRLDHVFQGDEEIDYHTYMIRNGWEPGEFIERPGVAFRRIRNYDDYRLEMSRLQANADFYVWLYESLDGREHPRRSK